MDEITIRRAVVSIKVPESLAETAKQFRGFNPQAALKEAERLQREASQYESLEQIHEAFDRLWIDLECRERQRQYDLHIRRGQVAREWKRQRGELADGSFNT